MTCYNTLMENLHLDKIKRQQEIYNDLDFRQKRELVNIATYGGKNLVMLALENMVDIEKESNSQFDKKDYYGTLSQLIKENMSRYRCDDGKKISGNPFRTR